MKKSIKQPYQFLMMSIGGFFLYQAVGFIYSITFNGLILILNSIPFYPAEIGFIFFALYHLFILLFFIIVFIKVINNTLKIPDIVFEPRFHLKVIKWYVVIYFVNLFVFYFSNESYLEILTEYTRTAKPFETIGDKIAYMSIFTSIFDLALKLFFAGFYIVLIRKEIKSIA